MSTTAIRVVIFAAATIWGAIALLSGETLSWSMTRPVGLTASVVAAGGVMYEKWFWAWPLLHRLTKRPVLKGTWQATQKTTFDPLRGDELSCFLTVRQTLTTIHVRALYPNSSSISTSAALTNRDGAWRLSYCFRTDKRTLASDGNPVQRGAAEFLVSTSPNLTLQGDYWMELGTRGQTETVSRSKHVFDTYEAAAAHDFDTPEVGRLTRTGKYLAGLVRR